MKDLPNAVEKIGELVSQRKGTAIIIHCGALSVGIRKKIGLDNDINHTFERIKRCLQELLII